MVSSLNQKGLEEITAVPLSVGDKAFSGQTKIEETPTPFCCSSCNFNFKSYPPLVFLLKPSSGFLLEKFLNSLCASVFFLWGLLDAKGNLGEDEGDDGCTENSEI